ncbi:hypothetical protein FRC06_011886 [Ceratobasidium sp. 370]|nr:hypothetical protein FRC06_011886 [Ceratobasidium sp. 370]
MATYIQWQESWALLRAYLGDIGQLCDDGKVRKRAVDEDEGGEEEGDVMEGDVVEGDVVEGDVVEGDVVEGDEGDNLDMWYPMPSISIAKRPSLGSRTGTYLIKKHSASDLIDTTTQYLAAFTDDPTTLALSQHSKFMVWSQFKLRHPRLPFCPATKPQIDQIRASPCTFDDDGQMLHFSAFDVVLLTPDDNSEKEGLHRFQAGRVRAIFEVPRFLQELCAEKLAYVELFRPFSRSMNQPSSLYTTGHMLRDRRRCNVVVPISRVRMAIHLAPRYNLLDPDQPISASTDLLAVHDSFYLNRYGSYFQFDVMEYWDNQRQAEECMVSSSSSSSPQSTLPPLELSPFQQLSLEPWTSNCQQGWELDLHITQPLEEHDAYLKEGSQVTLDPMRKLAKKRHRHTKDSNRFLLGAQHGQRDTPSQTHPGTAQPASWADYDELDSQLMQAAQLASLEQLAIEIATKSGALDEANLHAATPMRRASLLARLFLPPAQLLPMPRLPPMAADAPQSHKYFSPAGNPQNLYPQQLDQFAHLGPSYTPQQQQQQQ